jgi:hypothetical protein
MHPLLDVLLDAADGRFPRADGEITVHGPLDGGLEAVVAFTGHAHVATRLDRDELLGLGADGFGGAVSPAVVTTMAGGGIIGSADVTMVGLGTGDPALEQRPDLADHPRVRHAMEIRDDVRVFANTDGLVTISVGLASRTEMGVALFDGGDRPGRGRSLIGQALTLVDAGKPLFAAVAPGNARSLRAFLAAGFVPVASEIIVQPLEE